MLFNLKEENFICSCTGRNRLNLLTLSNDIFSSSKSPAVRTSGRRPLVQTYPLILSAPLWPDNVAHNSFSLSKHYNAIICMLIKIVTAKCEDWRLRCDVTWGVCSAALNTRVTILFTFAGALCKLHFFVSDI